MSGNLEGRITKLERECGADDAAGVVMVDERFSVTQGARPGVKPLLVVRIVDSWAWKPAGAV